MKSKFLNEDSRNVLKFISQKTIDLVLTSPPYFDLKDYGGRGDQVGFGQSYQEYIESLREIFSNCYKVTKETGSLWIVVDSYKKDGRLKLLPFEVTKICEDLGWILKDVIIWDKGKTLPWSHKGDLRNVFEYILFFTKTKKFKYFVDQIKDPIDLKEWWIKYPERYSPSGKVPANIWNIPIPVQGSWAKKNTFNHFCPFPPDLVEKILLLTTKKKDAVLDPFAGSGSVLAVSHCLGRKYVGFEVHKKFVKSFFNKLLPEIQAEFKVKAEKRRLESKLKVQMKEKIKKLRVLKYPKSIMTYLETFEPKLAGEVLAIYVKEKKWKATKRQDKVAFLNLIFLVKNFKYVSEIRKKIIYAMSKPPISKFGLDADVEFKTVRKMRSGFLKLKPKTLYTYIGGKTYFYHEKLSELVFTEEKLKEYVQNHRNGYPIIISPVGVRQRLIKTHS